jgi:hypothetical protein
MRLIHIKEPELMFGFNEKIEDPRDGLALFGPYERGRPHGISWGVIGVEESILRLKRWIERIQKPISNKQESIARVPFPGFEAVFGIPWDVKPIIEYKVSKEELAMNYLLSDRHQRVYKTVEIYYKKIEQALRNEDALPDIWFIVIPEDVYKYCRPESGVEPDKKIMSGYKLTKKQANKLTEEPALFTEMNLEAIPYQYEEHFHNQLKARLLENKNVVTQIVRESTIAHQDFLNEKGKPTRDLDDLQSAIAWNICTTAFYKVGGKPWKVGTVREGVCYVGLVFKQDASKGGQAACCGAQMFLDSGDGVVFKGADGKYYNPEIGTYHLTENDAKLVIEKTIEAYKKAKNGTPPKEIFLHARTSFNDEEWRGFTKAIDGNTNLVGVRIKDSNDIKLYRKGKYAALRGLAFLISESKAYLCTRGYVPRLQTCMGLEIPRLIDITITKGKADLEIVLKDIMMLTKLNYNACVFGDGQPITLKFSDAVGEILTAGPNREIPPLPFKYYI